MISTPWPYLPITWYQIVYGYHQARFLYQGHVHMYDPVCWWGYLFGADGDIMYMYTFKPLILKNDLPLSNFNITIYLHLQSFGEIQNAYRSHLIIQFTVHPLACAYGLVLIVMLLCFQLSVDRIMRLLTFSGLISHRGNPKISVTI